MALRHLRGDLRKALSLENMERAFGWLRSNPSAFYKNYFRDLYASYSVASSKSIDRLRREVVSEVYRPSASARVLLPKGSGIQRPVLLLSVEDQILYQSVVNVIAEKHQAKYGDLIDNRTFGNVYAGSDSLFFLRPWVESYQSYNSALRAAIDEGARYVADFDLTAFYELIDHRVLKTLLLDRIQVDPELVELLINLLGHWMKPASKVITGINHGIPQGPLASGIVSECVMHHFDVSEVVDLPGVRYFRYVDDIKLLSESQADLRRALVRLDLLSKELGLVPNSVKSGVRHISAEDDVIRAISREEHPLITRLSRNPERARRRLVQLSRGLHVERSDESRFKLVLGGVKLDSVSALRLVRILERHPHLYPNILAALGRYRQFPLSISRELLRLLVVLDIYASLSAELIRVLSPRVHPEYDGCFALLCEAMTYGHEYRVSEDLREAVKSALLVRRTKPWRDRRTSVTQESHWWVKSRLLFSLADDTAPEPSLTSLVNLSIRSRDVTISTAASTAMANLDLRLTTNRANVGTVNAQETLKVLGKIGRVARNDCCYISRLAQETLGTSVAGIDWSVMLGVHYDSALPHFVMWNRTFKKEPTTWVNITDTINDMVLSALYMRHPPLGVYELGSIGAILPHDHRPPSRALSTYLPNAAAAFQSAHRLRWQSVVSHAVRRTGATVMGYTRLIRSGEANSLARSIRRAYLEIWEAEATGRAP